MEGSADGTHPPSPFSFAGFGKDYPAGSCSAVRPAGVHTSGGIARPYGLNSGLPGVHKL